MGAVLRHKVRTRGVGVVAVVLVHAAVLAALLGGRKPPPVEVAPPSLEVRLLDPVKPPAPVPVPPPPPKLQTPQTPKPVVKPAPAPHPPAPAPAVAAPAATAVTAGPPAAPAAAVPSGPVEAAPEPARVAPAIAASHSCRAPQYPAASRRAGETGTVTLRLLIGEDGTVLDAQVEASSSHERLDEAARSALSLCHFTPGTVDGRPERAWARIRYVWKLT